MGFLRIEIKDAYGKPAYVDNTQDAYNLGWHQAVCMTNPCPACDDDALREYGNGQDTEAA